MQRTMLSDDLTDEFRSGGFVGSVEGKPFERRNVRAGEFLQREEFLLFAIGDNHLRALVEECEAHRSAKAARTASDNDYLSCEADIHAAPLSFDVRSQNS